MVGRKRTKPEKLLTEVELELMKIIWEIGECTVKEVQEALPQGRDLAYTSVATMMKILEAKGVLTSSKRERAHTYEPALSRADYESMSLRHLTHHVFRDDPGSMVMRLLDESALSDEELKSIRALLDERLKS